MSQQKNTKLFIRKLSNWNLIDEEWYYPTKINLLHRMELVHKPCYEQMKSPSIRGHIKKNFKAFDKCHYCKKEIPGYVKTIAIVEWI